MEISSVVDHLQSVCPEISRQRLLLVNSRNQKLYFYQEEELCAEYSISTSRYGMGNVRDSLQTPVGVHRVKNKIGKCAPIGSVFVSRTPSGEVLSSDQWKLDDERDLILTRILWLQGLQPGLNYGGQCDSYERYIYIHGTHEEHLLGSTASHGCIRMANLDIISLFEKVQEGDLVYIE